MSRKRSFLLAAVLAAFSLTVEGQAVQCSGVSFNEETITVSSTSLGFTASAFAPEVPGPGAGNPVSCAAFQVQADAIYVRETGAAATNTGKVLTVYTSGAPVWYVVGQGNIQRFRMLRVTNDATVRVTYYRAGN